MPWVRRTRHLAFGVDEDGGSRVVVRSLLTGRRVRLAPDELGALLAVSDRSWTWRADGDGWADQLGSDGLLVTDDPREPFAGLRSRDEELTALGWWPDAAALHLGARWEGVRARVPRSDGSMPRRTAHVAPALPAFPVRGGVRAELPRSGCDSPLRDVLAQRRTVRAFDPGRPVQLGELATLLHWVWGAHGTIRLAGDDVGLRRTSPSGGSFHPIEVYPVVRNVEGLAPGVYHYLGGEHALELVGALDEASARELLDDAMAGQWFFAASDVAFVMTARFGRSYRKYRRHAKVYRAVYLDAGHLSQTFYLLCTELGLGPWITAALDESVVERALGLDPLHEGVVAICGCGRPSTSPAGALEPAFDPVEPA
jgi:putative peptide maturation dehydrogenase